MCIRGNLGLTYRGVGDTKPPYAVERKKREISQVREADSRPYQVFHAKTAVHAPTQLVLFHREEDHLRNRITRRDGRARPVKCSPEDAGTAIPPPAPRFHKQAQDSVPPPRRRVVEKPEKKRASLKKRYTSKREAAESRQSRKTFC